MRGGHGAGSQIGMDIIGDVGGSAPVLRLAFLRRLIRTPRGGTDSGVIACSSRVARPIASSRILLSEVA